jgi:aryl carrier-like protein
MKQTDTYALVMDNPDDAVAEIDSLRADNDRLFDTLKASNTRMDEAEDLIRAGLHSQQDSATMFAMMAWLDQAPDRETASE